MGILEKIDHPFAKTLVEYRKVSNLLPASVKSCRTISMKKLVGFTLNFLSLEERPGASPVKTRTFSRYQKNRNGMHCFLHRKDI
jgi:hypothetical protein